MKDGRIMPPHSHPESPAVHNGNGSSHQIFRDEWRNRLLYMLLIVVVAAGLPAHIPAALQLSRELRNTTLLWSYAAAYLALLVLATHPELSFRTRSWGVLLLAYSNAFVSLARLGLTGSGRLYLIAIPAVVSLVIGTRAGYASVGLSLVLYGVFTLAAYMGWSEHVLDVRASFVSLEYWADAGGALAVILIAVIGFMARFYAVQARAEADRRKAAAELERSAATLQESEERLALVMQATNDGIWDWHLDTNQVYFSPRWKSMLGYQDDELANQFDTWLQLMHPEDKERALAQVHTYLAGDTPLYQLEHRLQHKDGSYRWILARGIGLRDNDGKLYRLVGSHTDVTEQRQAEAALRAAEAEWRALLAAMTDVILVLDAAGRYLKIAPTSPQLLYRPPSELLGKTLHELFSKEQADFFLDNIQRALKTRQPVNFEYSLPIGGALTWFAATVSPLLEDTVIWVARDVTEHKQFEETLQAAYQTLERRVAERTHELAALNAIAAVVSHSLDLHEIMQNALDKTLEVLNIEGGAAYCLDPAEETLTLMAHRGLSENFVEQTGRLSLETALAGQQINADQPVIWHAADFSEQELRQLIEAEGLQLIVGVPLMVKGRALGGLMVATHGQRQLTAEERSLLVAIAQQIALAVDNARLYQQEQARHEEAERRRQVAEGLREVLTVLNSRQSLEETLDFIATQACSLMGSQAASLSQLQGESGTLLMRSVCGLDAECLADLRGSLGSDVEGRAVAERRPVFVSDALAASDELAHQQPLPPEAYRSQLRQLAERFRAWLSVPIIVQDEVYGVITLYYHTPREFSEEEIRLGLSLADQAALAIESSRLRDQARRAAAITERTRLARELHDSVTQALYSVTLYAEAANRLLAAGQSLAAAEHLHELRDTAQAALREMRLLIFELRPLALEKSGLVAALQARLEAVEGRGGIQTELVVEGEEHLPNAIQEELYHIAREALNNVLKHANASRVRVLLHFEEKLTRLQVWDDGVGFEAAQALAGGGLGLDGMLERTQAIGGSLQIDSMPGHGATITVEVPVGGAL